MRAVLVALAMVVAGAAHAETLTAIEGSKGAVQLSELPAPAQRDVQKWFSDNKSAPCSDARQHDRRWRIYQKYGVLLFDTTKACAPGS